jgi:hypothetical protein
MDIGKKQKLDTRTLQNQREAGQVLVELLILVAVVSLIILTLISYFTTVTTRIRLTGGWATPAFTAIGPAPFAVKYGVRLEQITTTTVPFGGSTTTTSFVPVQTGMASVTFSLVGASGALFVTGGRQYTTIVDSTGAADIKMVAVNNSGDIVQATVNFNGGTYPDPQTIRFETHKP